MPADLHNYDVVILGAGLGGLLCGVLLAKAGMSVCILEKNKQVGGCLQSFALHKKVFDSSVHYIGGLGAGHTLNKIFRYAGILDGLPLQAMDAAGYDRVCFGEETTEYPHAAGQEQFVAQLATHFPEEERNLRRYMAMIKTTGDHFPLYRLRAGDALEKEAVASLPLTETIAGITKNKRLQQVLTGSSLLYAGERNKTPFYLHALVTGSYLHSAHKVTPASSQISKLLWQQLQGHGGTILRNARVARVLVENGTAVCAVTDGGERFYGSHFIANMAPAVLLDLLDTSAVRPAYIKRVRNLQQTVSSFMLNLVLKPGTVAHRNYNLYWNRKEDSLAAAAYDAEEWPANYAAYFTKDAAQPLFSDTLSILCYMHYSETAAWQQSENHSGNPEDRGPEYEAFKQKKSAQLLAVVLQRMPDLNGNILAQSAATPLTWRDYTATPEGSLYGILKNVHQPEHTTLATRTRIHNLLLTGQNVNLHGVLGVSITAVATCAELLGMQPLLKAINAA